MNERTGYWDKAKCEAWHGTAEVGSKEWSEQITKQRYFVQPHIPRFAQFDRWNGKRVLEIGCGIGTDTLEFAKAGAKIDALDFSNESVSIAGDRFRAEKIPYGDEWAGYERDVRFFWSNAENFLPFGSYDLIYSFGVLHHTPRPDKVLVRAHDVLADTGELRIMLYAKYSWKHLFTRQQPEAQAGCPYVKWYSKREARKLLESCGFRVVSIQKTHIFPWRIPEYRNHLYKKAFPWNFISEKYFERFLGHHLLIVAVKV